MVSNKNIAIYAEKSEAFFYGIQTLLQLLPKEIESKTVVKGVNWTIPCVESLSTLRSSGLASYTHRTKECVDEDFNW